MSTAYVSNNVPFGGLSVSVSRPTSGANPSGGASVLGTYLIESMTPTRGVVEGTRPGTDGGDNGWWLVNGPIEGAIVAQLAITATPTLEPGDYFESSAIYYGADGNGVNKRFVFKEMGIAVETTGYRKQSGSFKVDAFAA